MKRIVFLSFSLSLIFTTIHFVHCQSLHFAEPRDVSEGTVSGVSSVDVGDLNNDNLMDVVVLEGGIHAKGRFTLAWFEQTKIGKWLRHDFNVSIKFDTFMGSARCADVDKDGDIDLIFSNDGHSMGPIKVYFLENPGKKKVLQTWKCHLISSIEGFHANDMRLADIDADSRLDVILRHKNPESVKVIFQNDTNNWETKNAYEGQAGEGLAVGDINTDGFPDITLTGHWLKTPIGARSETYTRFDIEAGYKKVNPATKEELGDINGDGRLDVLLSPAEHFKKYGGDNYDLAWYECPERPEKAMEWQKHTIKTNYNKAHCAKLYDFDNDGDLDILSAITWDNREIRIFINTDGTFQSSIKVAEGKGVYSGAVADMDGDGDLDIVAEDKYAGDGKPWYYENLLEN